MTTILSIDPGKCKCGIVVANFDSKQVHEALVIDSDSLVEKVKVIKLKKQNLKVIIGNGTTHKLFSKYLKFLGDDLIIAEERNTTLRSKQRYFGLFPRKGFKRFVPREVLLRKINLDAIAALIILEDYTQSKFEVVRDIDTKTWRKQ